MPRPHLPYGAQGGPLARPEPPPNWNEIAFVYDAPTRDDIISKQPLSGPAGAVFERVMSRLSIDRRNTAVWPAFSYQPAWTADRTGRRRQNDVLAFFGAEPSPPNLLPPFLGRFLRPELATDLVATCELIRASEPRVVITLGRAALWSLTHLADLNAHRGRPLATHACLAPVYASHHPGGALARGQHDIESEIEADIAAALEAVG